MEIRGILTRCNQCATLMQYREWGRQLGVLYRELYPIMGKPQRKEAAELFQKSFAAIQSLEERGPGVEISLREDGILHRFELFLRDCIQIKGAGFKLLKDPLAGIPEDLLAKLHVPGRAERAEKDG